MDVVQIIEALAVRAHLPVRVRASPDRLRQQAPRAIQAVLEMLQQVAPLLPPELRTAPGNGRRKRFLEGIDAPRKHQPPGGRSPAVAARPLAARRNLLKERGVI